MQTLIFAVIVDLIVLKIDEDPEIFLKLTPIDEILGSLTTSVSHWTQESVLRSPFTHNSKYFSLSSYCQLFSSKALRNSCIKSFGFNWLVRLCVYMNCCSLGLSGTGLELKEKN